MRLSILSLFVLAMLAFSSCQKLQDLKENDKLGVKDDDKADCFKLIYPVTYTMPDGSEITMNHADDWAAIKAWYEAHPDSKADFVLHYPVEIAFGDQIKIIENEEAMILAKKACNDGQTDKVPCFKLVYPVSYTMPDGSSITMNNGDDWAAIKAWYEAHPDSKADIVLQYPVKITSVKFDGVKVINNDEEMVEAKKACDDSTDELKVCDWDGSKVSDPAVWEAHIVEPIVTSEDCGGCIVSGVVKYVKIGTDFAYVVYYGKGECDEWAYLTTYYGATSDKKETKCKFKLDCDSGN